ncbi:hypothetical protein OUZ56_030012 [Daphnia magna]|uniref:Uncharacterized protein n=1 Tax=Daphnia magna TaxID=35525 RepID=A0ABR0B8I3_9CRUS|nr:hypothetical protein OUZ56_030012 [Daphnia magna]
MHRAVGCHRPESQRSVSRSRRDERYLANFIHFHISPPSQMLRPKSLREISPPSQMLRPKSLWEIPTPSRSGNSELYQAKYDRNPGRVQAPLPQARRCRHWCNMVPPLSTSTAAAELSGQMA